MKVPPTDHRGIGKIGKRARAASVLASFVAGAIAVVLILRAIAIFRAGTYAWQLESGRNGGPVNAAGIESGPDALMAGCAFFLAGLWLSCMSILCLCLASGPSSMARAVARASAWFSVAVMLLFALFFAPPWRLGSAALYVPGILLCMGLRLGPPAASPLIAAAIIGTVLAGLLHRVLGISAELPIKAALGLFAGFAAWLPVAVLRPQWAFRNDWLRATG
jgi:hypothetical protein